MTADRKPMVKLAELWERQSAAGRRYFSGFLGGAQLLLFDNGEHPHPTRPGETVHVWRLMLQERDPSRRP
jgi:acyl dehydratase